MIRATTVRSGDERQVFVRAWRSPEERPLHGHQVWRSGRHEGVAGMRLALAELDAWLLARTDLDAEAREDVAFMDGAWFRAEVDATPCGPFHVGDRVTVVGTVGGGLRGRAGTVVDELGETAVLELDATPYAAARFEGLHTDHLAPLEPAPEGRELALA